MIGLVALSTSIFTACGGPKLSANETATNFLNSTFKDDLRVEENADEYLDFIHSSVSDKESALEYGIDFYDTIDEMTDDFTEGLECDATIIDGLKKAFIQNVTIAHADTATEADETKVSFDVTIN